MQSKGMAGHLIRRLHQHSTQVYTQHMQEAGYTLTSVQFAALDAIASNPGIDQAGVAAAIAYDRATIGGVISRLEKAGFIARQVSATDRRARTLNLTETGRDMFAKAAPIVQEVQHDILAALSEGDREHLLSLAQRILDCAQDE